MCAAEARGVREGLVDFGHVCKLPTLLTAKATATAAVRRTARLTARRAPGVLRQRQRRQPGPERHSRPIRQGWAAQPAISPGHDEQSAHLWLRQQRFQLAQAGGQAARRHGLVGAGCRGLSGAPHTQRLSGAAPARVGGPVRAGRAHGARVWLGQARHRGGGRDQAQCQCEPPQGHELRAHAQAHAELKAQIDWLLNRAKAVDDLETNEPDIDIPSEIQRRAGRLAAITAAKLRLKQRQKEADSARGRSENDQRKPRDKEGKPKGGRCKRDFSVPKDSAQELLHRYRQPQNEAHRWSL